MEDEINYTLDNLIPDKFKNHLLPPRRLRRKWDILRTVMLNLFQHLNEIDEQRDPEPSSG